MIDQERYEYVKYRLESAYKTYEAAQLLANSGFWNSAINRLYYALFYAVNALLVTNSQLTKSHSGTKLMFSQQYVKTGIFDKKYGKLLSELFDSRQKGDYENIFDYNEKNVLPLFDPVLEMIKLIEKEINKNIE